MGTGPLKQNPALLLLYHAIGGAGPDGDTRFSTSREAFREHLRLLRACLEAGEIELLDLEEWWSGTSHSGRLEAPGTEWVRLSQGEFRPAGGLEREQREQPGKGWHTTAARAAVLCFDDGSRSDYEQAFPLLQEAGLRATFFISSARVGQSGYLGWSEIAEMQRGGMRFQSHGHEHRVLSTLSDAALERELRTGRQTLQQHAGTPVHFLSAPFGFWNRRVLESVRCAGFRALCTSRPGLAAAGNVILPRNSLRATTSARQLQRWLHGRPGCFAWRMGREGLLWIPKQVLLRCHAPWPERPAPARLGSTSTF
ncbi:MAG: polysaccharide deacetylase family protein [Chloroflexota bacterium]